MLDTQPDIRYDRPVYFGPGCDVAGADMVSVICKTAFDADELGLTFPVRLVDGSAFGTRLACVSGINSFYSHTFGESFVADKRPELPECPRMNGCALVLTNGYPVADAREVFKGDATLGVFGLAHNRLADDVIRVGLKPLLLPSELLEMSLRASSSSRLKTCSELGYTRTSSEDFSSRMGLTVRVEGKVTDTEVDPEPALGLDGGTIGDIDGHEEVKLAVAIYEVGLSPNAFKASPVVVPDSTWNGETTVESKKAHAVETVLERVESLVVSDGSEGLEYAELGLVSPVNLADLADGPNRVLSRETEMAPNLVVEELLKLELVSRLQLESLHGKPGTSLIHSTHGREKTLLLFRRGKQLHGGNELHGHRLGTSKRACNQKGEALPPRPEGRGFRAEEQVKETWRPRIAHDCAPGACDCDDVIVRFDADSSELLKIGRGIPDDWTMPKAAARGNVTPLFMPRWASRLTLEVTDVRVERLHDISEDDARAEGADGAKHVGGSFRLDGRSHIGEPFRHAFFILWRDINGEASLATNPWLWVLAFRRLP